MEWSEIINDSVPGLVQIAFGAWILAWWSHRRDQRTLKRTEALKFIEVTADRLNEAISCLFGIIRQKDVESLEFRQRLRVLFEKRLATRIQSRVLLGSGDFARQYERIMFYLRKIDEILVTIPFAEAKEVLRKIDAAIPLEDREDLHLWAKAKQAPEPWNRLEIWAEWIWSMSDSCLAGALRSAIRGRKFKLVPIASIRHKKEDSLLHDNF